MTSGIETLDIIEPWLISTLKAALIPTELVDTVINAQTSENVQPPYLLISLVSSRDVRGVGTVRIDTNSIYMIKAVHRSNSFMLGRAAMRAVDLALSGTIVTTTAGSITCVRESQLHYPETLDGMQFMHVTANYRIRAASH